MHPPIIGGSDASISAVLRAQELASDTEITILLADAIARTRLLESKHGAPGSIP
jgi:hypothetical protein